MTIYFIIYPYVKCRTVVIIFSVVQLEVLANYFFLLFILLLNIVTVHHRLYQIVLKANSSDCRQSVIARHSFSFFFENKYCDDFILSLLGMSIESYEPGLSFTSATNIKKFGLGLGHEMISKVLCKSGSHKRNGFRAEFELEIVPSSSLARMGEIESQFEPKSGQI